MNKDLKSLSDSATSTAVPSEEMKELLVACAVKEADYPDLLDHCMGDTELLRYSLEAIKNRTTCELVQPLTPNEAKAELAPRRQEANEPPWQKTEHVQIHTTILLLTNAIIETESLPFWIPRISKLEDLVDRQERETQCVRPCPSQFLPADVKREDFDDGDDGLDAYEIALRDAERASNRAFLQALTEYRTKVPAAAALDDLDAMVRSWSRECKGPVRPRSDLNELACFRAPKSPKRDSAATAEDVRAKEAARKAVESPTQPEYPPELDPRPHRLLHTIFQAGMSYQAAVTLPFAEAAEIGLRQSDRGREAADKERGFQEERDIRDAFLASIYEDLKREAAEKPLAERPKAAEIWDRVAETFNTRREDFRHKILSGNAAKGRFYEYQKRLKRAQEFERAKARKRPSPRSSTRVILD